MLFLCKDTTLICIFTKPLLIFCFHYQISPFPLKNPKYFYSFLQESIKKAKKEMQKASKQLDYANAKIYRDEMFMLQQVFDEKFGE